MEQDGVWKSARKSVDKSLLKNIIRHTDAHNKIQEQNEMWKQWELKKQSQEQNQSHKYNAHARGYMRSDIGLSSKAKKESLKWNRLLLEYEETRNDRWGHSGYKELYPDEFHQENGSEAESDQSETERKMKIENENSKSTKQKKSDEKTRPKKPRKLGSDCSEGDVDLTRKKAKINYKMEEVNKDTSIRKNREKDRTLGGKKDSKTKRVQSKESRKIESDSADSDVETGRRKRSAKSKPGNEVESKVLVNNLKSSSREKGRKVILDRGLNTKCFKRKEKSESKYTENSFRRKRDDDLKNGRQDRKRRSESSDENGDEMSRKQNKDHTSRKSSQTVKTGCSPKKKIKR